jgi:hypothetical protein
MPNKVDQCRYCNKNIETTKPHFVATTTDIVNALQKGDSNDNIEHEKCLA